MEWLGSSGKVVFVPYTVTGDKAWIEIIEEKKKYSMGRLIQIDRTLSLESESSLPLLWELWRLSVATHRLFGSRRVEKRDFKGDPRKIREAEGNPFRSRMSPSPQALWLPGQGPIEGEGKSHRLLSRKIPSDCGYRPLSHLTSFGQSDHPRTSRGIQPPFLRMEEIEINVSPEEGKGVLHPSPSFT